MSLYAGVDLHGNNGYYAIIDEKNHRVFKKRLPNDLLTVLSALEPYRKDLVSIAVESTYNWYWLVDGLVEVGYDVRLANPSAIEQYDGLKNADDKTDAFFLAELLQLKILPEGYIYPKEDRPVRDLLRRRLLLVKQRTQHILSFQSLMTRHTGTRPVTGEIKKLKKDDVGELFDDEYLAQAGTMNVSVIRFLTKEIRAIENSVLKKVKLKPEYEGLLTVPGIGKILGMTIMLETGNIARFKRAGHYSSYCRCVRADKKSNNKKKGANNRKNGNRYLAWAFVEAANFCVRYCPEAKKFYEKKKRQTKVCVAIKALSSKLSKACYFITRDQVEFDISKIFH